MSFHSRGVWPNIATVCGLVEMFAYPRIRTACGEKNVVRWSLEVVRSWTSVSVIQGICSTSVR
jgi:hypothetical protein